MTRNIQISSKLTLHDLDNLLSETYDADEEVQLWLPTQLGSQLFKYNRVCYLIASLSKKCRLSIVNWSQSTETKNIEPRFQTTLEGLASIYYSRSLVDPQGLKLHFDQERTIWDVNKREGRVETTGLGVTLSYCCFDEANQVSLPTAFSRINTDRSGFINDFKAARRKYFEQGVASTYSQRIQPTLFDLPLSTDDPTISVSPDDAVASFIFEIFQNGFRHGCRNADGSPIPGLRYVSLRKHIGFDRLEFVRRASGFQDLEEYLATQFPTPGTKSFLEISVADHGMGIIRRFLATRPEYGPVPETNDSKLVLLNRIISQSLSSNTMQSGAGRGLGRALEAVRRLRGFVSLRTDNLWLVYSPENTHTNIDQSFREARNIDNLPDVPGTHFNLLFPM